MRLAVCAGASGPRANSARSPNRPRRMCERATTHEHDRRRTRPCRPVTGTAGTTRARDAPPPRAANAHPPSTKPTTRTTHCFRSFDAERLADAIEHEILSTASIARTGKVLEVIGTLVKVAGLDVTLGELCELRAANGELLQHAEVIGFTRDVALLSPFSRLADISRSTRVVGSRPFADGAGRRRVAGPRDRQPRRADRRTPGRSIPSKSARSSRTRLRR